MAALQTVPRVAARFSVSGENRSRTLLAYCQDDRDTEAFVIRKAQQFAASKAEEVEQLRLPKGQGTNPTEDAEKILNGVKAKVHAVNVTFVQVGRSYLPIVKFGPPSYGNGFSGSADTYLVADGGTLISFEDFFSTTDASGTRHRAVYSEEGLRSKLTRHKDE